MKNEKGGVCTERKEINTIAKWTKNMTDYFNKSNKKKRQ